MGRIVFFLGLLALFVAMVLGFGWVDDPQWVEDFGGFLAAGLLLCFASELVPERRP